MKEKTAKKTLSEADILNKKIKKLESQIKRTHWIEDRNKLNKERDHLIFKLFTVNK